MTEITTSARCPECGVARNPAASACHGCGLLFVNGSHPQRRESDRRRASDLTKTTCRICRGSIEQDAQRCLHCGEIIDPEYRAARARQLRAQVNYASWIAYILGFLMLFVFRPVGVIAIIAGLLLSIAYYAIRIPDTDADEEHEEKDRNAKSHERKPRHQSRLNRFLRRQFGIETIRLGSSNTKKMGLVVAGTPLLLVAIGWATNYSMLQIPIDRALMSDTESPLLEVAARYEYFVLPGSVVLEIEELDEAHKAEEALMKIAQEFDGKEVEIRFGENSVRLAGERFRGLTPLEIEDLVTTLSPRLHEPPTPGPAPSRQVRIPIGQP